MRSYPILGFEVPIIVVSLTLSIGGLMFGAIKLVMFLSGIAMIPNLSFKIMKSMFSNNDIITYCIYNYKYHDG